MIMVIFLVVLVVFFAVKSFLDAGKDD